MKHFSWHRRNGHEEERKTGAYRNTGNYEDDKISLRASPVPAVLLIKQY